jgi:hypothetical protein
VVASIDPVLAITPIQSTLDNTIIQSIAFDRVDRRRPQKSGATIWENAHRQVPSQGRACRILGGFRCTEAAGPVKIFPAVAMPPLSAAARSAC